MKKLLVHPALDASRQQALAQAAPGLRIVHANDPQAAADEIRLADGFLGKLTPPLLRQAERLTWVQAMTASLEHYLFPELIEHPAVLTNMRGLFSDVIADHVLGLVLCFARNLHVYIRQQQQGLWAPCGGESGRTDFVTGPGVATSMDRAHLHLADQTLCVVGLGGIGRETARRAALLGMTVLAVDPRPAEAEGVQRIVSPEQVDSVLSHSDFVVLAAPHTPHTQGWWNRDRFQAMKTGAYLINVGRGAIVVTDALRDALAAGRLGGAALDVVQPEPLPSDDPLWRDPNVIITPHVAACSPRIAERHLQVLRENVQRFQDGLPLVNVVDKIIWC